MGQLLLARLKRCISYSCFVWSLFVEEGFELARHDFLVSLNALADARAEGERERERGPIMSLAAP